MRYKFLFIFLFSTLWMQSFSNRLVGQEVYNLGSRSHAMGMSGLGLSESSGLIISNPARLATFTKRYNLHISIENNSTLERRSFTTLNSFDDFLTYSDYVANLSSNNYINFGATAMQSLGSLSFGLGLHRQTLYDLKYNYIEEVRGIIRLSDGVYGTGDPIVGQHVFTTSGEIQSTSIGGAVNTKLFNSLNVSLGLGISQLEGANLADLLNVQSFEESYDIPNCTSITDGAQYDCLITNTLANVNGYDSSYVVDPARFFTVSSLLSFKNYDFMLSYESESEVYSAGYSNSANYLPDSLLSGVFQYTTFDEVDEKKYLNYGLQGIDFYKPKITRLGLIYSNLNPEITLSMELENRQHARLKNITIYKIGFEYVTLQKLPIRFGLVYKPSYFNAVAPTSIFTFGTRLSYGRFNVDLSGSYSLMTYSYPDFFPIQDEFRNDLDQITESRTSLRMSIEYGF